MSFVMHGRSLKPSRKKGLGIDVKCERRFCGRTARPAKADTQRKRTLCQISDSTEVICHAENRVARGS